MARKHKSWRVNRAKRNAAIKKQLDRSALLLTSHNDLPQQWQPAIGESITGRYLGNLSLRQGEYRFNYLIIAAHKTLSIPFTKSNLNALVKLTNVQINDRIKITHIGANLNTAGYLISTYAIELIAQPAAKEAA